MSERIYVFTDSVGPYHVTILILGFLCLEFTLGTGAFQTEQGSAQGSKGM
jgi:hypothetical protein